MGRIEDIEDAIVAAVEAIPGVSKCLAYEPDRLPPPLPVVTLLWVGQPQDDRYTGPATENANRWQLSLYCSLSAGWKDGQRQVKALWPQILRVFRVDPTLDGTAEWTLLTDTMEPPTFDSENKHVRKSMLVDATHEES